MQQVHNSMLIPVELLKAREHTQGKPHTKITQITTLHVQRQGMIIEPYNI